MADAGSIENEAWWASDIPRLQDVRCCCGLARVFSGRYVRERMVDVPWGWRWLKVPDLDAKVLLPLWLYWPVRLWSDRYRLVFRPLIRLGLWRVREPAGYYVDGHLTAPRWLRRAVWCFINDADHAPRPRVLGTVTFTLTPDLVEKCTPNRRAFIDFAEQLAAESPDYVRVGPWEHFCR